MTLLIEPFADKSNASVPLSVTPPVPKDPDAPPAPTCSVPALMVVVPEYVLAPVRISVPIKSVSPPVPEAAPAKVPEPLVRVRVFDPRVTPPAPDRVTIDAPDVVPEMEKVPPSETPLELAIEPEPERARVPELMVVGPV
jgi:hypothetical protein